MPATHRAAASQRDQAHHQSQPSPISTTPAAQNGGGCRQVPRLPREPTAGVAKCHACHAKSRGVTAGPSASAEPASPISTMPATQNGGGCYQVPRLPRETTAGVAKCHACHAKSRGVTAGPSVSAEPAQSHKYYACHTKRRWMLPSATPAT